MANGLDIIFLGTASAQPSKTRNVSGLALRIDDGDSVWLFDCGEGTQRQIMNDEKLKLSKVKKILVTHNHGDHIFGLPGLLLTSSALTAGQKDAKYQIIGPKGLRQFLRVAFLVTYSHMGVSYSVDELLAPGESPSCGEDGKLEMEDLGRNIEISDDGFWHISHDDERFEEIIAAPIEHTIPTVGFIIKEADLPGSLLPDLVKPRLMKNKEGFAAMGVKNPMALMSKIKNGETIELPDGSFIYPSDVVGPPKLGRKIVILGDTSNPSSLFPLLSQGCDVVVHEATNSTVDEEKSEEEVEKQTLEHGHSTPQIAGTFAKNVNAKVLLLNHFSSRYKGDQSEESLEVMQKIKMLAVSTFGNENVFTAYDHFCYPIPKNK